MTKALKAVGIAIPANERIWNWIHEHQGHVSNEISKGLNMAIGSVTSQVSQLEGRKMLRSENRFNKLAKRNVKHYYTCIPTFMVLPAPRKKTPAPPPVLTAPAYPPPLPISKVDDILNSLNVSTAFELHKRLREMFGDKG